MIGAESPAAWQYFLNPWWQERQVYVTSLDLQECRRRLDESTSRFLWRAVGRGMVSAADYTLHHVTFWRNSFRPYAYVKLDGSMPPQTIVRVTLSAPVSVRVFFVFWYAFLLVYVAVGAMAAHGHIAGPDALLFGGFVVLFAAMPMAMNTFGRVMSQGDRDFLTGFLMNELELREPLGLPIA
jgi:hypothetical protein